MNKEKLKEIHEAARQAKVAKINANTEYVYNNGVPIGTIVWISIDRGYISESIRGVITKWKVSDRDLEIYYTVRPIDAYGNTNYDILLGRVKQDGFEIAGEKNE